MTLRARDAMSAEADAVPIRATTDEAECVASTMGDQQSIGRARRATCFFHLKTFWWGDAGTSRLSKRWSRVTVAQPFPARLMVQAVHASLSVGGRNIEIGK